MPMAEPAMDVQERRIDTAAYLARLEERLAGQTQRIDEIVRRQESSRLERMRHQEMMLSEIREWREEQTASRDALMARLSSEYVSVATCGAQRGQYLTRGDLARVGAWMVGIAIAVATGLSSLLISWFRGGPSSGQP